MAMMDAKAFATTETTESKPMIDDKIAQAEKAVSQIHSQRPRRIAFFFILLLTIGLLGGHFSSQALHLNDNFSWGFLTEMVGAAITLIVIEVAFQRSEETSSRNSKVWFATASEQIASALEAKRQAEEALMHLQQTISTVQEELQSAQQTANEYKSIAAQTMISDLNKTMSNFTHALDEYRLKTDPKYAIEKTDHQLQHVLRNSPFYHQAPAKNPNNLNSLQQHQEE